MTWFRRSAHPEDQLSAYADGELDGRAHSAVEAHLAGCDDCSRLLEELQAAKLALTELPRLEPRRSFVLGPEHAVASRPERRRASFTFAPAAALTVLMALLFVDAVDFSGGSSNDSFSSAGSTANSRSESAATALDSQTQLESTAGGTAASDASAPTAGGAAAPEAGGGATSALAPPVEQPGDGLDKSAIEEPAGDDGAGESGTSGAGVTQDEAQSRGQSALTDDSSDGPPLLRILEAVAAIVLVASSVVVFGPRLIRRGAR